MIKIDIISGFLGAGKTTLIQKLFKDSFKNEKIVLIENEFGEIGIDGSFLKEFGVNIKEINSGCICCSLVGDFAKSLTEVIERFTPERIIIEPSGVGKLSDIKNAVLGLDDKEIKLNILATVVDGSKAKMHIRNFGEFFNDQVKEANSVVVSRVDRVNEEKLHEVVKAIKEINPHCNIITTAVEDLDGSKLLETLESNVSLSLKMMEELEHEHVCCHHEHHEHEHECCHHEHHDHDHECCHHEHDHEHECCHHEHHDHEHECCHHEHHEHDHEHECCHHEHDHEHECCHHEHHDHEHECCHHEHHEHDHECGCGCHDHHHHHHADEVFTSWGEETVKAYSRVELENILTSLRDREDIGAILRSKGILKASDQEAWYYFDFVSGDYEIREGSSDVIGRVCVIGSKIDVEKIKEIFLLG